MATKAGSRVRAVNSGTATMVLTCLLGIASYFFGQPMAIELHWFWMALGSLCIVVLAAIQFIHALNIQRRDDELRAILDAVPHSLFFKDTSLRYRVVNAEFESGFGFGPGSAIGKTDVDLFGAALAGRFGAQDKSLMGSGEAATFDDAIEVDGTLRSIRTRKQPVRDRRGKVRGIVGVAIDVTEQTLLQSQLEDAHERLSIALEVARMGTWEVNLRTGELHADARARQILGMTGSDLDIEAAFARVHPDDEADLRRRIEQARVHEEVAAYEFRIVDDSGAVRWVEGFSSPNRKRGRGDAAIGVNRDITERRLAELALADAKLRADRVLAELEQSQSHLALALAVGGLGVWRSRTRLLKGAQPTGRELVDTEILTDPKIRQICGLGDADTEISYHALYRLLHPADRARVAGTLGLAYRQGAGAYHDQFRIRARDGVVRSVDVRGSVTKQAGLRRDEILFTGIAKDITQEEALKADLITKAEEARSALDAKRQFLAMMSHEVRTPLTGVLGMIDLTLDSPLTEVQRTMLMRSRESSVALLTIINDILDFSKITARKLDIESRPVSLRSLVEDVCMTSMPEAARKGIDLAFSFDDQIPEFILGDAVRLRQVLTNLIGNAVKFTKQGGVKVMVARTADHALLLTVQDTGIGIDPEAAKTIFLPFRQADVATTRRFGGTGLGLTIVRQLVELMRGRVHCESEPGVGSRFIVKLPLQPWIPSAGSVQGLPAADRHAADAAGTAPIGEGRRLLLAEDHPINREVIVMQLAKLGFACDCAEDGEEAWERLLSPGAGAAYALLLTDCHMPRLSGYDLTTRLREREAAQGLPRLPIVALTANALQGERERCLAVGMDGYLSKPLQLHELRQALVEILPPPLPGDAQAIRPGPSAGAPTAPAYAALTQLCGGRLDKVAQLLGIFVAATEEDLKAMDRAVADGDPQRLKQMAHRLSSACHQLDETRVAAALQAIERRVDDGAAGLADDVRALQAATRQELVEVLARASAFVQMHAPASSTG